MSTRWFNARRPQPWCRWVVESHTQVAPAEWEVEPVARYWSRRRAVGLARVLNVLARNGVDQL